MSAKGRAENGVQFTESLTWKQIQAKAKAENKYIFVDCYATWCGPCKEMDHTTYLSEKVGAYINDKFISVKAQLDSSSKDNELVKKWYADADFIRKTYNITAYPSFLFFSPDGRIVHRDFGYKKDEAFISLLQDALNPNKQYYTLLDNYQHGKKDYASMPDLADMVQKFGDKDMATSISQDYLNNYLYKLPEEELYNKKAIEVMTRTVQSSKEKAFDLFVHHGEKVDEVMGQPGYSRRVVDFIVSKEEIYSHLLKGKEPLTDKPDWDKMQSEIAKKYNEGCAERTILNAKLRWYEYKQDWPQVVKYNVYKIDKNGIDTSFWGMVGLNDMIYGIIFMHSNDRDTLNKAIGWEEIVVKKNPTDYSNIDTYANLLYKVGRKEEAIQWEQKAIALAPDNKEFKETCEKMKNGLPTWVSK
jgi:thiol-disulfide isomerase/thioredoxin